MDTGSVHIDEQCEQILFDYGLDTPAQVGQTDAYRLVTRAQQLGIREQFVAWLLEQPRLRFGVRVDLNNYR